MFRCPQTTDTRGAIQVFSCPQTTETHGAMSVFRYPQTAETRGAVPVFTGLCDHVATRLVPSPGAGGVTGSVTSVAVTRG